MPQLRRQQYKRSTEKVVEASVLILTLLVGGAIMLGYHPGTRPGSLGSPVDGPLAENCAIASTGFDTTNLSDEQKANAQAIAGVALKLGLGKQGVLVGITAALTESGLANVNYGDTQNGSMTSSRGLFQQLIAWGSLQDRMTPVTAATMFYTGGQSGQPGLIDIPDWQQLSVPAADQAVQQSEFADGSNYADNLSAAQSITDAISSELGTCIAPAAPSQDVTIPDDPNVAPEVRGAVITVPSPEIASGLVAGLHELGMPYVWGGAGDDGCARGGGAYNSCQGIIGWDCSGLTRHVIIAGGLADPGIDSATQRDPNHAVPWEQGQPGDIVGFPGHVAIYLGAINGTEYILEASDFGIPVHVVPLTREDHDPDLYRYWT